MDRHCSGERCADVVTGSRSLRGRLLADPEGSRRLLHEGAGEVELAVDVGPEWPGQRERALEQSDSGTRVVSVECAPSRREQPIPGAQRERVVGLAQLRLVAGGLLEVVADELVPLDEGRLALEPVGEAAVQIRAHGLRQSVVGGVADEQVAEAEAVLAGELRPVGADQLVPDERGESGSTSVSSGASACTAPRWKISPSTAPRSSTERSCGSS